MRNFVFIFALFLAASLATAVTYVTDCIADVNVADTYVLTNSVSIVDDACFPISANDVTIDCDGNTIQVQGNPLGSTGIGIVSTADRTTIMNCNIVSISQGTVGIFFLGADDGTIINNNINASDYGISIQNGHGISITNTNATINFSDFGTVAAIYFLNTNDSSIINSNGYASGLNYPIGIYVKGPSSNNLIQASIGNSSVYFGMMVTGSFNNITSSVANGVGLYLGTTGTTNNKLSYSTTKELQLIGNNNIVEHSTINEGFTISSAANNNITNNSISGRLGTAVVFSNVGTTNCTFLQNNITQNIWVNFSRATPPNYFSVGAIGNIWNFANGTPASEVYNITCSGAYPCYADSGGGLPFNETTLGSSLWDGDVEDSHPYSYYPTSYPLSFYDACISNYTQYGANRSYIERYIQCSMGRVVGNSETGGLLLGLIVAGLFITFILFQNTRIEGKIVIIIPVVVLVSIWAGWIMYIMGIALGLIVFWAISKMINR